MLGRGAAWLLVLSCGVSACGRSHTPEADAAATDGRGAEEDGGATPVPPLLPMDLHDAVEPTPRGHEPLCIPWAGPLDAADLWADTRGVFVLASMQDEAVVVAFDEGSARWRRWWVARRAEESAVVPGGIHGVAGASLLVWPVQDCWITELNGSGASACASPEDDGGPGVEIVGVLDVHRVDEHLAWALTRVRFGSLGLEARVMRLSDGELESGGTLHTPEGSRNPSGLLQVWGDGAGYFALSTKYLWASGGPPDNAPRSDVPAATYASLWGDRRDSLWIGTEGGDLLHFDATDWSRRPVATGPIRHLWGGPDALYFGTDSTFGRMIRADGPGDVQELLRWDPRRLRLHGIAGHEGVVYLVLEQPEADDLGCAPLFVLKYEGGTFHRL